MSNNIHQQVAVSADAREKKVQFLPFGADPKDPQVELSIGIVQKFIATRTKAGHTCSDRDALKFVMLCQSRGLNPWEGDCFLIGYDAQDGPQFSLITSHQAFLKRAELNPEYDGMQSGVVVKLENGKMEEHEGDFVADDETLLGGWAKVFFKTRKYPIYRKLHIGAFNKGTAIWKSNPAGMIVKTAEADALRSAFPTKCGGMYLQSEAEPGSEAAFRAAKPVPADLGTALTNGNGSAPSPQDAPRESDPHPITSEPRNVTLEPSQQQRLADFLAESGVQFSEFAQFGVNESLFDKTVTRIEDVPAELAKRLLRNKSGILAGISAMKGAQ